MTPEERAAAVLKPLFNPEPHPLQDEWSDAHSMSLDGLASKLAEALRAARLEALEEAAKVADAHNDVEVPEGGLDDELWVASGKQTAQSIADEIRDLAKQ